MWLSVHYARPFAIAQAQMEQKLVSIIRNSRVYTVEGFERIDSLWKYSQDIQKCPLAISQVSAVEGCLLSRIPL